MYIGLFITLLFIYLIPFIKPSHMGLYILIPLIILVIITWLSYLLSDKLYAAVKKDPARPAKSLKILFFVIIFAILAVLTSFLFLNNFVPQR